MTVDRKRSRGLLVLVLATVVLSSTVGPAGAVAGTDAAQLTDTEIDLQASLTGDLVVVAGWFELTARVNGTYNTSAQATDLGGTVDIGLADEVGEFAFRGQVVGTVDASRILFTVEGNATGLSEGLASMDPPSASAATGGELFASGFDLPGPPVALAVSNPLQARDAGGLATHPTSQAPIPDTPLQTSLWRQLGISFLDLYWQLATLVLGLVLVGVLPRFSHRVADLASRDPLRTGGVGLAVVLIVPVALLVLGLSLFGIPLALAGAAVYLVLWWIGTVYGRLTVGQWLLGAIPRALAAVGVDARRIENRWAGLLVGVFVVGLLVLIPTVGPVIEALVLLLGLGGVSRVAYRRYRRTERAERAAGGSVVTDSDGE